MTDGGTSPEAMILAGPNGAGKTTSAADLIPPGIRFLNSDLIAAQVLQTGHPPTGVEVTAGRILLGQIHEAVTARESFCLETTLAGRSTVRWISQWQEAGYRVRLVFVGLDNPDLAVRRVAGRVADGGHDVPEVVIRRRWAGGLRSLFELCLPTVDDWLVIDNSNGEGRPLAAGARTQPFPLVMDSEPWSRLIRSATEVGAVSASRYER